MHQFQAAALKASAHTKCPFFCLGDLRNMSKLGPLSSLGPRVTTEIRGQLPPPHISIQIGHEHKQEIIKISGIFVNMA